MPKKILRADQLPTLVMERLSNWGRCIHTQRIRQRITAADLCARMSIAQATLRRLERGDPGAGVGAYLTALLILGVLDEASPALAPDLWAEHAQRRVRHAQQERDGNDDGDYF